MDGDLSSLPDDVVHPFDIQLNQPSQNISDSNLISPSQVWTWTNVLLSLGLFVLAGLMEIGGGYLVWIGIREKKWPYLYIPVGAIILFCYGIVPTFQPVDSFGRVYAVYGGFFIALSYAWVVVMENFVLDMGDYLGISFAITGVLLAWFWPR